MGQFSKALLNQASRLTRRFARNQNGNVAMMFALTLFAMIGGTALAVDMSNAYSAKERLQNTTDAIALMAAKEKIEDPAELTAAAQAYFESLYPGADGSRIQLQSITRTGDEINITASNTLDTYFTGIFGRSGLDVGVASTAIYADKALDVALVLDTTFSMTGSKMASLKSAANGMLTTFDDADNENLRVSVVPFSQYVNVGLKRRSANWLDVPDDSITQGEEVCKMRRKVTSKSNCRRVAKTCTNDGVSYDCSYTKCDKTYGLPYKDCRTPVSKQVWKGCVGSRENGYDTKAAFNGRRIPGLLNVNCGTELQELTTDMNAVKRTVSKLKPQGETYMPAGLLWGWRTLDQSEPLSFTTTVSGKKQKVIVLMTDGENSRSKDGVRHSAKNRAQADKKTQQTCSAIKNEDVIIYTIAYEVNDKKAERLISDCATDRSKFFSAQNASDLVAAFRDIGASLNELRLS